MAAAAVEDMVSLFSIVPATIYTPVALGGLFLAWGNVGFPALEQVSPEKLLPTANLDPTSIKLQLAQTTESRWPPGRHEAPHTAAAAAVVGRPSQL